VPPYSAVVVGAVGLVGAIQEKADALPRGLFPDRAADGAFPAASWLFAACLPSPRLDSAETLTLRFELAQLTVAWPPSVCVLRFCSVLDAFDRGAGAGSYAAPVRVDEVLDLVGRSTFILRGRVAGWYPLSGVLLSPRAAAVCRHGVRMAAPDSRRLVSAVSFVEVCDKAGSESCFSPSPPLSDVALVVGALAGWLEGAVGDSIPSELLSTDLVTEILCSLASWTDPFIDFSLATNSGAVAFSLGLVVTILVVVRFRKTASSSGRTNGMESLSRSLPYNVMRFRESRMSAPCMRRVWLPMKTRMAFLESADSCWSMPVTSNEAVMLGRCGAGLADREFDCVTRASARNTGRVIL
jgi:hypothetical protein